MKIYLAGRIEPGDWREELIDRSLLTITDDYVKRLDREQKEYEWPIRRRAVFRRFDYVGPYLEEPTDNVNGFLSFLASEMEAPQWNIGLDLADLVLAYFPTGEIDPVAALEIGYAVGKKKEVYVAAPSLKKSDFDPAAFGVLQSFWMSEAITIGLADLSAVVSLKRLLTQNGHFFDSPIEEKFWKAFVPLSGAHSYFLDAQHEIGQYRADFAIPELKLAIELDGHEYHKTKEQRTHDAKRDRFFMEQGWRVARFTGTEIHSDVRRCIQQVLGIIDSLEKGV